MVPSLDWFIYAFVRKEAVLSSQIEGTQATLVNLLTFEAQEDGDPSAPASADVEEICNYLDALTFTLVAILRNGLKGLGASLGLLAGMVGIGATSPRRASTKPQSPKVGTCTW